MEIDYGTKTIFQITKRFCHFFVLETWPDDQINWTVAKYVADYLAQKYFMSSEHYIFFVRNYIGLYII